MRTKLNIRNTIISLNEEPISNYMSQEGLEYWMENSENIVLNVTTKTVLMVQKNDRMRFNVLTILDNKECV